MPDEVLKLRFHIAKDIVNRMEEEEYEAIEMAQDGDVKMYRLRPLLARFVVNEDGSPMDHKLAMKVLGKITLGDWGEVINAFVTAMRDSTVPKANGNLSEQHSEANAVD